MNDCPLVRLGKNLKILRKFEQSGEVAIPVTDWLWFFEALDYIHHGGSQQDIYCTIVEGYLALSKTPFKKNPDAVKR